EYGTDPVALNRVVASTLRINSAEDALAIVPSNVGSSGRRAGMGSSFGVSSSSAEASGSNVGSSVGRAGMASSFGIAGPSHSFVGSSGGALGGHSESDDDDESYGEEDD
ncbi:hypothetical protein CF326_g8343, partial [Tilletia indica]